MALIIIGLILLIFGFLLCLSIIGAVVGIPLMMVGIILMALGGRRRIVIRNTVNVSNVTHVPVVQGAPVGWESQRAAPSHELQARLPEHTARLTERNASYDRKKWETLLRYDGDLRAAAEKVRRYGPLYEDELAEAYLNINDKSYLDSLTTNILHGA